MAESTDKNIIPSSAVEFHEIIGRGGFARQVYSASLKLPSGKVHKVAAKKVRGIEVSEVTTMRQLDHNNIVKFYGILEKNLDIYVIMELAENGNLRHYLDGCRKQNKTRLPLEIIWKWIYEGACGIRYLNEKQYGHRDVKSLNYLLTKDYTVKLGDLALAQDMDLTQDTSGMRGSCRWMAPEVIMEQKRSVKSDVFSFGMVVWEVCTTEVPFEHVRGDFQVMNAICKGERPSIPDDCLDELKELMTVCWKVDINDRPDINDICAKLEQRVQKDMSDELSKQLQLTTLEDESMETEEEVSLGHASYLATDCEVLKSCKDSLQAIQIPQFYLVV